VPLAIETFALSLLIGAAEIMFGAVIERLWPARDDAARSLGFNLAYNAQASLIQAVLTPWSGALMTTAVNALGGGLITLPTTGWGLVIGVGAYFLVMDLGEYVFHRAQHAIPWLWSMHSLHHSDPAFNISTATRHFWFDVVIKTFTIYLLIGLVFKAGSPIVLIYGFITLYNYFTHMNVKVGFGRWSFMLNSPQYHRLHHSRLAEHYDVNFAALLPIFELLSGTYRRPQAGEYPPTGLEDGQAPASLWRGGLWHAFIWPLHTWVRRTRVSRPGATPASAARQGVTADVDHGESVDVDAAPVG
jgi:sterol desaturase/sphingolipid hydroxylase (fatty acid hydroxylase superfamily)